MTVRFPEFSIYWSYCMLSITDSYRTMKTSLSSETLSLC
uniref:Uncharacterized protein n=1 Tax=Anguilla anguilla TaxID=7936 RepID=A0A0E9WTT2_ANGAN